MFNSPPILFRNAHPAEVRRGCRFAALHKNAAEVAENLGTISGTVSFDGGVATFGGSSDYITYSLAGHEFGASQSDFSAVVEFWPEFATDEDSTRTLFVVKGSGGTQNFRVTKRPNADSNVLRIQCGGTQIANIAEATYSPAWLENERNVLTISATTGDTSVWLNTTKILDADATAWTPADAIELEVACFNGSVCFKGSIGFFELFQSTLVEQEALDYYNRSTFTYMDDAIVHLPMRDAQHDATGGRTLDVSGNGNDGILSGGVTKRTERGYELDGVDGRIVLPSLNAGTCPTVSFMCVPNVDGAVKEIFGHGVSGNVTIELFSSGTEQLRVRGGAGTPIVSAPSGTIRKGVHSVFSVAIDNTVCSIYQDGVLVASGTVTAPDNAPVQDAIGAYPDGSFAWACSMLEFVEHDICLTPIQVHDLHAQMMRRIHEV
jgi:hypothetical protein